MPGVSPLSTTSRSSRECGFYRRRSKRCGGQGLKEKPYIAMICGETNISIPIPSSSRRVSCFYTNIAIPGKGRSREDTGEGKNKKKRKIQKEEKKR
jgi:hypothetical protein